MSNTKYGEFKKPHRSAGDEATKNKKTEKDISRRKKNTKQPKSIHISPRHDIYIKKRK